MSTRLKRKILRDIKQQNVRFVHLWFTDILGQLKSISVEGGVRGICPNAWCPASPLTQLTSWADH